jgi:type I restriction enzyme M protein
MPNPFCKTLRDSVKFPAGLGSGGLFVQCERYIEEHGHMVGDIMVSGPRSNPTTRRLAAMNTAIHGIDFAQGTGEHLNPRPTPGLPRRLRDGEPILQHHGVVGRQSRRRLSLWKNGTPPRGNANFAGVPHKLPRLLGGLQRVNFRK